MNIPRIPLAVLALGVAIATAVTVGPAAGRSIAPPAPPIADPATDAGIAAEPSLPAPPAGGAWDEAARLRAEGSYARALAVLRGIARDPLSPDDRRWLDLLLADSAWRAASATTQPEDTELEAARADLERLARVAGAGDARDRIRLEAEESLGDFHWMRRDANDWSSAWSRYASALEGWAASRDLELARARYLGIVRKASRRLEVPAWWRGGWRPDLPADVVENAAGIARDPDDVALTRYLLALALRRDVTTPARYDRAARAFDQAVGASLGREWLDDALWESAQLRIAPGRPAIEGGGRSTFRPEWPEAVRILRDLVGRFDEGRSRYVRDARRLIEEIESPAVEVMVGSAFLPGSEIEYHLSWRNVARIELALYAVDLARDVAVRGPSGGAGLADAIDLAGREPIRAWSIQEADDGRHVPRAGTRRLDAPLVEGAYVLTAEAGGRAARTLVAVSRTAAVLLTDDRDALVHVGDALDGTPRAGATVALWIGDVERSRRSWTVRRATTDADGFARFRLDPTERWREIVAVATAAGQPAFARSAVSGTRSPAAAWGVHVFPDRPAYRPGETARFKAIARSSGPDGRWSVPEGRALGYRVTDPRGTALAEGAFRFNAFGGAWGEIAIPQDAALGDCRIEFTDPAAGGRSVGGAVLFGVEEYRLPEFRVEVRPPTDDDGRPRTFRPGDDISIDVVASYYFGGPVAGARAEIVITRAPRWVILEPPRPYPWIARDESSFAPPWIPRSTVLTTTVTTDDRGRATVSFPTPMTTGEDATYTVEARVTDAARREVAGSGSVQVTRQRYFVSLEPDRRLVRPGDDARAAIRAIDGNDRPLAVEGRVRVTRDVWDEVWIDPWGREVRGAALDRARRAAGNAFPPPPPDPGGPSWRLKFRGHRPETVAEAVVRTTEDGTAEFSFVPPTEGFYRVAWSSETSDLWPVNAETAVWATTAETRALGYRPGGLEIVVDRDAFRSGEEAAVMLVAPTAGMNVLFAVEPGGLDAVRLVRMTGDVRLLRVPLDARHAPNVWLRAAALHGAELLQVHRSVDVAPVDRAFDVAIELDGDVHLPGSEGRATVRAIDLDGRPIVAEVALGIFDEAVEAIRPDTAGDPRAFFLGARNVPQVRLASSFDLLRYLRLDPPQAIEPGTVGEGRADDSGLLDAASGVTARDEAAMPGRRQALSAVAEESRTDVAFAEQKALAPAAPGAALDTVEVRTDFRATASWTPAVVTGEDGRATVAFRWPESLTSWKAVARAADTGTRFGYGTTTARTSKPLTVRLQTPRFLVAGDVATVSAILNNNGDVPLRVETALDAAGIAVETPASGTTRDLAPGAEARVEWTVRAGEPGEASFAVRSAAIGGPDATDGMVRALPVEEHGVAKFLARSGKVRGGEVTVLLDLPAARRPGSTTLTVQISPSLAVTALDALPYLIDYPYGCTEQTLSRFLPAVIVRRTLVELGLDASAIEGRMFGGIEPRHVAAVQGDRGPALGKLDEVVRRGLARLADFQHGDGSWGWWKEGDGDPFMSAYALWGLSEAAGAGIDVDRGSLRRAADWLDRRLVEHEDAPDLAAWMLHALAAEARLRGARGMNDLERAAFDRAFADRDALNAYGKALLALAAHGFGDAERARVLVRNLENGVIRDETPDRSILVPGGPRGGGVTPTAHWGSDRLSRRWSDGPVETTSFALRALVAVQPEHPLIAPVTEWLVKNRRGAQWRHTRETAIAVLALTDVLARGDELAADFAYTVEVNGVAVADGRVTPATALSAPLRIAVDPARLRDGENRVRIVRTAGTAPIHFAVEAGLFSREEPVAPAGTQVFVGREYVARSPYETLLAGTRHDRTTLPDGGAIASGDRVDVVLTVEAKNDLEYLVFEDLKPAGFEAVDQRSGDGIVARRLRREAAGVPAVDRGPEAYAGETVRVYRELRDRKVATFLDRLPEGVWEIRYELRAETPGTFHGLPVLAHAMYVPEIRANGAEQRVTVEDR